MKPYLYHIVGETEDDYEDLGGETVLAKDEESARTKALLGADISADDYVDVRVYVLPFRG